MPQMNPIWWLSLFTIFIIIIILSNSLNYFYKMYNIKMTSPTFKLIKCKNWKW